MHVALTLAAVIVLGGQPVPFGSSTAPQFTSDQLHVTAEATRAGLARWAATAEGQRILAYFAANHIIINVTEDADEPGLGRAPDPRLQILVAAAKHTRVQSFDIVLNPQFFRIPEGWVPLPNEPTTPADAMAAAWAGEMLHVYFYAQGIALPHHARADFQAEWREVASQLGWPSMTHDDETSLIKSRRFGPQHIGF